MNIDGIMDAALRDAPGAVAIACADVRAGLVLGASAEGDDAHEAATDAAACAGQICALPLSWTDDGEERGSSSALVVSSAWIHAFSRVARRPELVVVGVARGDGNAALLVDWVRRVATGFGDDA